MKNDTISLAHRDRHQQNITPAVFEMFVKQSYKSWSFKDAVKLFEAPKRPQFLERIDWLFKEAFVKSIDYSNIGQAKLHIPLMGGGCVKDNFNVELVSKMISLYSFIDSVYWHKDKSEDIYFIVIDGDDVDLQIQVFDLYWEISDQLPDYSFEFRPFSKKEFQEFNLPQSATKISGR
ncbi:hypothetical protein [Paenibacillus chitinolyticus]|uniref:hypothetical protein n=1 Tax=Paenibacillus chitinolyticus TaxID=79263 RepID=UPI003672D789